MNTNPPHNDTSSANLQSKLDELTQQLAQLTNSNQSLDVLDLIEFFNLNPQLLKEQGLEYYEVTETTPSTSKGSTRKKEVVLEIPITNRGDFWILSLGTKNYLFPKEKAIRESQKAITQRLFDGYKPGNPNSLVLIRPAQVTPIGNSQQWKLAKKGEFKKERVKSSYQQLEDRNEALETKCYQQSEKIETLQQQIAKYELGSNYQQQSEEKQELASNYQQLVQEKQELKSDYERLGDLAKLLQDKKQELETKCQQQSQELERLREQISSSALEPKYQQLQQEKEQLESQYQELQNVSKQFQQKLETKYQQQSEEIARLREQVSSSAPEPKYQQLQQEKKQLESQYQEFKNMSKLLEKKLETECQQQSEEIEKLRNEKIDLQLENFQLVQQVPTYQHKLEGGREEISLESSSCIDGEIVD